MTEKHRKALIEAILSRDKQRLLEMVEVSKGKIVICRTFLELLIASGDSEERGIEIILEDPILSHFEEIERRKESL